MLVKKLIVRVFNVMLIAGLSLSLQASDFYYCPPLQNWVLKACTIWSFYDESGNLIELEEPATYKATYAPSSKTCGYGLKSEYKSIIELPSSDLFWKEYECVTRIEDDY